MTVMNSITSNFGNANNINKLGLENPLFQYFQNNV